MGIGQSVTNDYVLTVNSYIGSLAAVFFDIIDKNLLLKKGEEQMRKKIAILLSVITISSFLTGCCISHEWQDATCSGPKKCVKCEETEGEALPHTWVEATCSKAKHCEVCQTEEGEALPHTWIEATYQTAKTCEVCNTVEGEPLTPDFVTHNMKADCELDTEYDFVTCSQNGEVTLPAKVIFTDYQTFESDETHEAKEGYEWKKITIQVRFSDEVVKDGWSFDVQSPDYYKIQPEDAEEEVVNDVGVGDEYTVNWNGVDYAECVSEIDFEYTSGEHLCTVQKYYRIPIGYDGQTVGVFHGELKIPAGEYIYDQPLAKDGLLFRMAD